MKKSVNILKAGAVAVGMFGFATLAFAQVGGIVGQQQQGQQQQQQQGYTLQQQQAPCPTPSSTTWNGAPGTPPNCNVPYPVNTGSATQTKTGVLAVTGFANWGESALTQKVVVGTPPCTTCVYGGGGQQQGGGNPTSWAVPKVAVGNGSSFLGGLMGQVKGMFTDAFNAPKAMAELGGTGPQCPSSNGYCTYNDMNGIAHDGICAFTDTGWNCQAPSTGGTTGGSGFGDLTIGSYVGAVQVTAPVISFYPAAGTITGGSDTLTWSVSNASACSVGSANGTNDWNQTLTVNSSTHAGGGTHSAGTYTVPGTYTYDIACSSPSGGAATATATITVGTTYILDVYGNANIRGYLNTSSFVNAKNLKQNGVAVCLKDGTNCPAVPSSGVSGAAGYMPKFTTNTAIGNSIVQDFGNFISVNGEVRMDGPMVVNEVGTAGGIATGIRFGGTGSGEGISSRRGSNNLELFTGPVGGAPRLIISNSGNVGINADPVALSLPALSNTGGHSGDPAIYSGTPKLQVYGDLVANHIIARDAVPVYRAGHDSGNCSGKPAAVDASNQLGPLTLNGNTCGNNNTLVGYLMHP